MTLRNYQIYTLVLLGTLLFVPWVTFAEGSFIQETLWGIVVAFFGLFVGFAAYLLDTAINGYVIGFGLEFTTKGIGVAVDQLWYAVRDIFNLTFIFGLVFIGFKMILNSDDSNTRRWLVNLLMAALLVNFSLFITKFIVDFSNIMATQIAHAFPADPSDPSNVSISHGFMNLLGLQQTLGIKHGDLPGAVTGGGSYGYIFGTMIMFIVMTFVFAAGGLLLLIRFAALSLYMVLSPLMFLGWVFPQLQSVTATYWRGFLGRAFFAPIYLLLVYFSYFVLAAMYKSNAASAIGSPDYQKLMQGGGQNVLDSFSATFPPFVLTCVFLIASIVVANKMGADGAGAAMRMGNSAKAWTQRKATQYAYGGARMAGRGAAYLPAAGMRRGSYALGSKLNQQIDRMQAKGGLVGKIARSNAFDDAARSGAGKLQNAKYGLSRTIKEEGDKKESINKGVRERAEREENLSKLRVAQAGYETAAAAAKSNVPEDQRKEAAAKRDAFDAEVKQRTAKLTDDQISSMTEADMKRLTRHMNDKQLERYYDRKGDSLGVLNDRPGTATEKLAEAKESRGEILEKYTDTLENSTRTAEELGAALKGLADTVKGLSEERLKGLSMSQLTDERVAMHLSDDQIKTLETSGNFSAAQINQIKTTRENGINKTITQGSVVDPTKNANAADVTFQNTQRENIFKRGVADVGKLPVSAFTQVQAFDYITPAMLEARMKNGISGPERAKIRAALEGHLGVGPGALPSSVGALSNNPWTKWERSNSTYAHQFFA